MVSYPATRVALKGLPRRVQQVVNTWMHRGIPRTAQILIEYEQVYHALKSDLSSDQPTHTS